MSDAEEPYEAIASKLEEALTLALKLLREEQRPAAIFRACDQALRAVQGAAVSLAMERGEPLRGQYQSWFLAGRVATSLERLLEVLHHQTRRARGGRAGDVAKLTAAHAVLLRRMVSTLMEETETDRQRALRETDGES